VLDATRGALVAERFGLGGHASLAGPVAFGRLGAIWQLVTERGCFAVKHAQFPVSSEEAELDAAFQESVRRAGVPMPAVVRAVDGAVVADVGGDLVRVYEWVDVLPADRRLDPGELGQLLAAIHAVVVTTDEPVDGWYVDPVGAEAWQELLVRLRMADARSSTGWRHWSPTSVRQRASSLRRTGCRSATGTCGQTTSGARRLAVWSSLTGRTAARAT
jgi:Ser/Thr protein kinase RdoA (MazF antagonist)